MPLSVVILGAGNMAHHVSIAFHQVDVTLLQVYNRSLNGLKKIASAAAVPITTDIERLNRSADIYIIAIKDDAIAVMAERLAALIPKSSVVAHTSGSCSIDVFKDHFKNYGAFYPLQSLNKDRPVDFKEVPVFISSSNDMTTNTLTNLAGSITKKVIPITDKERALLHIPAVFVNNFVNYLYTVAQEFCQQENLPFEHLSPLMKETVQRVIDGGAPSTLQTGPAIRHDKITINNHRKALVVDRDTLRLYNYLTQAIQEYHEDRK